MAAGDDSISAGQSAAVLGPSGGIDAFGLSLTRSLSNAGVLVIRFGPDLRAVWSTEASAQWLGTPVDGRTFREFLPEAAAKVLSEASEMVLTSGTPRRLEIFLPLANRPRWCEVWLDAEPSGEGRTSGLTLTAIDVTDQKHREQTLRTLLREVAHRSKNLLAIIQSIATQTGRHADSVDVFLTRFRGRLQSMASTQDLVTSSNWRGADLQDLIYSQITRYVADPRKAIVVEGDRPYLNPNAALHLGLALHELAVNSVSYGALARPEGSIVVSVHQSEPPLDGALVFRWSEAIPAANRESWQKRFGSTALERVVPAALNGSAELTLGYDRLTYTLVVPSANFATA